MHQQFSGTTPIFGQHAQCTRVQRYTARQMVQNADMSKYRPTERMILLALRLAQYERPDGMTKEELREQVGGSRNAFDSAWSTLLAAGLVINQAKLTEQGNTEAKEDFQL